MNVRDYLSGVFQAGTHSHFYLFSEEGAALEALYVLFCKTKTGCRHCEGCRAIASESSNDVFFLQPETGMRIKDEQVEEALRHTETKPSGEYRVVVICEAEKMTVKAQNHLLKSLEEAPDQVIYLMETKFPESLLPTVVSRAIRVRSRKERGETTELTKILLKGTPSQIEKELRTYKDNRNALIDALRIAVDEFMNMYLEAVKKTFRSASESERGSEAQDSMEYLEKMVWQTEEVIRNLEQSGNFDLNIDMLIYGRHFG